MISDFNTGMVVFIKFVKDSFKHSKSETDSNCNVYCIGLGCVSEENVIFVCKLRRFVESSNKVL